MGILSKNKSPNIVVSVPPTPEVRCLRFGIYPFFDVAPYFRFVDSLIRRYQMLSSLVFLVLKLFLSGHENDESDDRLLLCRKIKSPTFAAGSICPMSYFKLNHITIGK